ncbi:nucleoside phosphorylase [Flagellimonas myxillae]|uniref:nucleoside phosphorylase n=1 Tax=Flagellimonas myxillae TaxID=2942214 RepID=UPI00201ECB52|nr:nucleoside phosphorylase [Muricauda myxillae]MCL6265873.1 nucleoside phosphorylase [Muricauda myxillae]
MALGHSELILNPDGSIYHLNLHPEDISDTIITVGDPDRVRSVSKYFDSIEIEKSRREFLTHTGAINGKRITVISTGIGTDNIDIVFNELDALVNVDFSTRQIKDQLTILNFIRIGTSGAIQHDIPVDSFLLSESAVGFDGLMHFYATGQHANKGLEHSLNEFLGWNPHHIQAYAFDADAALSEKFKGNHIRFGITATNSGFYGPQGRSIRLTPKLQGFNERLASFSHQDRRVTNLEMETAGIYGLAKLHGHRAVSLNAILANRSSGEFSKSAFRTVDNLIKFTLEKLTT